jgi:hypothetical protein
MKMGLAKNEKFVRTIQTFWEQTLIRELIEAKNSEWEDRMFATDEEIKYYYSLMKRKVTFKVVNAKSHSEAKEALDAAHTGSFEGWTTLGPMTLDQAGSSLEKAFPLAEGEGEIFKDESGYLVVYVVRSEEQKVQPLDAVYTQLKRSIRERKRTNVLDEWLGNIRGKAVITINRDVIESSFAQ